MQSAHHGHNAETIKKKFKNDPTQYFIKQNIDVSEERRKRIEEFVKGIFDIEKCILCKSPYDLEQHLPKILIHCGHTICMACVTRFHKDARVRCPMCLKLIRSIETVDKLPTNHTIYAKVADELRKKGATVPGRIGLPPKKGKKQAQAEAPPVEDDDSFPIKGMENCESHQDRLKHFFCLVCKSYTCRLCAEVLHSKTSCQVLDLYELEPDQLKEFFYSDLKDQGDD